MSSSSDTHDVVFKVITAGEYGAGKTSLLSRFTRNEFRKRPCFGFSVDFETKTVEQEGKRIKLFVIDTSGAERFRSLPSSYCRPAQGVFFVFDTTSAESFQKLSFWFDEIESRVPRDISKILIGTKSDLSNKRQVSQTEIDALCAQRNVTYVETSSRDSVNVDQAFHQMIALLLGEHARDHPDPSAASTPSRISFSMAFGQNEAGCYC